MLTLSRRHVPGRGTSSCEESSKCPSKHGLFSMSRHRDSPSCEMRTRDDHQSTHFTIGRHFTRLGSTSRAQVPSSPDQPVTCTQPHRPWSSQRQPSRKTHHHQIGRRGFRPGSSSRSFGPSCYALHGGFQTDRPLHRCGRRLYHFEQQFPVMRFAQRYTEFPLSLFRYQTTDLEFSCESDDGHPDPSG